MAEEIVSSIKYKPARRGAKKPGRSLYPLVVHIAALGYLKAYRVLLAAVTVSLLLLASATPASAHDQPDGANWLMADWMLLSFLIFFGAALVAFLVALKLGALRHIEDAKYHILTINEPDYYTPDWAKEESHAAANPNSSAA